MRRRVLTHVTNLTRSPERQERLQRAKQSESRGRVGSNNALRSGETYGWATPSRLSLAAWASRASTAADEGQKAAGKSRRDACRTAARGARAT